MQIFSVKGCPWPFSWTVYTDIRETSGDAQDLASDDTKESKLSDNEITVVHWGENLWWL